MKAILSTKVYLLAPLFWLLVFAGSWHNCQHSNPSDMRSLDSLDNAADDMSVESDDDDNLEAADHLNCKINSEAPPEERYENCILEASNMYDVRPALLWALIKTESGFNPKSYSRKTGASGLMGVVGASCADRDADLFDPQINLGCGARVFSQILVKYQGDEQKTLVAYVEGAIPPNRAVALGHSTTRILDLARSRERDLAKRKWFMKITKSGTYRPFSTQAHVFCTGDRPAIKPGESLHQYGKAVDLQGVVDKWGNNVDLPPVGHNETDATRVQTKNLERLYQAMHTHGFLGKVGAEWNHFDFHGKGMKDPFILPPVSFNCRDWTEGRIKAPPQPEGLETWGINHVSKELVLTPAAQNALQRVNTELTRDQ